MGVERGCEVDFFDYLRPHVKERRRLLLEANGNTAPQISIAYSLDI